MDILPVQATSVPCKHVFSSAKDTDTAKQNQISPLLMEALQLLKFSLKKQCLNFTAGWSTSESAIGAAPEQASKQASKQVFKLPFKLSKLLNAFFVANPNLVMDDVLHEFTTHDHDNF